MVKQKKTLTCLRDDNKGKRRERKRKRRCRRRKKQKPPTLDAMRDA